MIFDYSGFDFAGKYKTRTGPEFLSFFWPGPVRPGPVSGIRGPDRFDPDRFQAMANPDRIDPARISGNGQKGWRGKEWLERMVRQAMRERMGAKD